MDIDLNLSLSMESNPIDIDSPQEILDKYNHSWIPIDFVWMVVENGMP